MALKSVAKRIAGVLRRRTPGLYAFLIKQMSSPWSRTLRNFYKIPRERRLVRENAPLFAVDLGARCGLGAMLSYTGQVLAYCDDHQLSPRLLFTNPVYAKTPGENWLPRYFEQKGPLNPAADAAPLERSRFLPQSINTTRLIQASTDKLTLTRLHSLFVASLAFRPALHVEAEQFCDEHDLGSHTVGVHYRGTDKSLEASVVAPAEIADQAAAALAQGFRNLFIATDEPSFLAMMQTRFGKERVVDLDCKEIFAGGAPAHLTAGDPTIKANEALQTMLVLSRCGLLIRTRSHLSAWSKIMNPTLPVIAFGDPYDCAFPERLIETDAPVAELSSL